MTAKRTQSAGLEQKMLMREKVDLGELREICNDIVSEDHRASEVIRRLRKLYKRGDTKMGSVDLNELIRETLDLLRPGLLSRQVIRLAQVPRISEAQLAFSHRSLDSDYLSCRRSGSKLLHVLIVLAHSRREVLHFNVAAHSTVHWVAQMAEAFPWDSAPRSST